LDYLSNWLKCSSQHLGITQEQCNWLDALSNWLKCSLFTSEHLNEREVIIKPLGNWLKQRLLNKLVIVSNYNVIDYETTVIG